MSPVSQPQELAELLLYSRCYSLMQLRRSRSMPSPPPVAASRATRPSGHRPLRVVPLDLRAIATCLYILRCVSCYSPSLPAYALVRAAPTPRTTRTSPTIAASEDASCCPCELLTAGAARDVLVRRQVLASMRMLHASTLSPNHHGERWNGRCAADKGRCGREKKRCGGRR